MSSCLLPSYNNSKPLVFNLTDAVEIMNRKITVNNMSIDCLQKQVKYSENVCALQILFANKAQQKIELVNKLNHVLSQQLATFDEIRQDEVNELYKELNDLDGPDSSITALINVNKDLEYNVENLMNKINTIEKTIPDNKMMTNFKVKFTTNTPPVDPDAV